MAIIQKIRNRAGLLVAVVIGAALLAFILGDFLKQGNVGISRSKNNIAEINGKGIPLNIYQNHLDYLESVNKLLRNVSSLDEQTTNAIREQAWKDIVSERVMGREYQKLGLAVHSDELADLILSSNPHPIVRQFFGNPNTGEYNPQVVKEFWERTNQLDASDPQHGIIFYIEDIIERDRHMRKYNTLLNKGLFATSVEAKRRKTDANKSVDFSYVVKRYSEVADTNIAVSDAEIKAYYKKHKEKYKQEQSRDFRYAVWEITPTQKDVVAAEKWINESVDRFKKLDNSATWQYIKSNSDIAPNDKNYTPGELTEDLDNFAFSSEEGAIYGPYFEDNFYKIAKLAKIEFLPDSVRASHILLKADQNNYPQMMVLADSLKKLAEDGSDFSALAIKNSQDGSAQDGGDLGWFKEGAMVKPFNDSCFYGKTGDIKLVISQFGIHVIKIKSQSRKVKKAKVGILAREVRTDDADDVYFMKANKFGGLNRTPEQFEAAVKADPSIVIRTAANIRKGDQNITGLDNSRQLVRWAFTADKGAISDEVSQYGNKYIVAILDKIKDDEYAAVEDVKSEIEIELKKQKQGEKLIAELSKASSGASSISDIASKSGTTENTATNIRFSSYSIPQLGSEPKLIASSVSLEKGKLSTPIDGVNGVYVFQVDNVNSPEATEDFSFEQSFIERSYNSRINYTASTVLEKLADLDDKRIVFF